MNKYSLTFKDEEYEEKEYRKQCHSDTSTIVKRILFIILFVSISMMINQLLATQEYKLIMVPFFNVIFFGIYKFGQKKEIVLDYFLIFIQLVLLKLIFFLSQVNILKNDTFEQAKTSYQVGIAITYLQGSLMKGTRFYLKALLQLYYIGFQLVAYSLVNEGFSVSKQSKLNQQKHLTLFN